MGKGFWGQRTNFGGKDAPVSPVATFLIYVHALCCFCCCYFVVAIDVAASLFCELQHLSVLPATIIRGSKECCAVIGWRRQVPWQPSAWGWTRRPCVNSFSAMKSRSLWAFAHMRPDVTCLPLNSTTNTFQVIISMVKGSGLYTATYRETRTAAVYNSKWRTDQH